MREEVLATVKDIISEFTVKNVQEIDRKYEDRFIKSVAKEYTLQNGNKICREEILKGGADGSAVIVVPVVGEKILAVIEPRVFTKLTVGIGFPAGYVNPDESPVESAKRELREETGYEAHKLVELDSFYQDEGCSSALNRIYLATDCEKKFDQQLDKDEHIKYILLEYEELLELEKLGYVMGSNSKLALLRIEKYFRKKWCYERV